MIHPAALMLQSPAVPIWLWVLGAYVGGCFTGWVLASKSKPSEYELMPSANESTRPSRTIRRVRSKVLEVRCKCGATHKFAEGAAALGPDFKPFPQGDTFTCPDCGRDFNLQEARKLAEQAGADIGAR